MRLSGYYSALITLHHAHEVYALGLMGRALKCHRVAAFLASASPPEAGEEVGGGECVRVSARGAEIGLIGLARAGGSAGLGGGTREMGMVGCACVVGRAGRTGYRGLIVI